MNNIGLFTPLGLNAQSELMNNRGLTISPSAVEYQGSWTPSLYQQGTVTSGTVLNKLTASLPNFYQKLLSANLDINIYRNLIKIGRPIDRPTTDNEINCPALGNSRPDSFKTSYAGFGSWSNNSVDRFYNRTTTSTLNLVDPVYPPKNYPVSGEYSYIYKNWGSKTAGPYSYNYQWDYPYAWITGYPACNSWQNSQDSYSAAYFPRPDLRTRDQNPIEYDEYFSKGFIATVARHAYYQFWSDYETRRINQYNEFVNYVQLATQFIQAKNQNISSLVNSKIYMRGNYSNINDLTTSDISGVSLSFKIFGNDCIRLGKSIDLSNIHKFGLPSILLRTLQNSSAITDSLKLALLYNNLSVSEINNLLSNTYTPSPDEEKKIYQSFKLITGDDLESIKIIINCTTTNLSTLADLLDPMRMFPNSYRTLTVPRYSIATSSSKIYDFIYLDGGVNKRIQNWGDYLNGILPDDLALACGAFMMTMNQIRNIHSMEFEKISQVIANLEVTNKDLNLLNNTDASPVDTTKIDEALNLSALGSGNSGSYRLCDFLGSMSGLPYNNYYDSSIKLINQLATVQLSNVYEKLYQKSLFNNWALISRGKGWVNPNINPSPSFSEDYAYELFVTQSESLAGTNSITVQKNLMAICTTGTQLSFNSDGTNSYTVQSSTFDGNNTTIVFTSNLSSDIAKNTKIYIFENIYNGYPTGPIQDLIDAANLEILRISIDNPDPHKKLNYYWDQIGNQLFIEQRAVPYLAPETENIYSVIDNNNIGNFVLAISNNADETEYCGFSTIIESISDLSNLGGQSIVGLMRESRNSTRLSNSVGSTDSIISSEINSQTASAVVSEVDSQGTITKITVTYGGYGYDDTNPPTVTIGPYGGVFGGTGYGATAVAVIENKSVIEINITNGGYQYADPTVVGKYQITIDDPPSPQRLGNTDEPGSYAGSPWTGQDPVPDNLVSKDSASYTVNEAIDVVTTCNCDCWNI